MARFVHAEDGPRNTVIYTDVSGKKFIFSGGDRTWRNNNPGNLVPGRVSKRNGAIGVAGNFAVFPDYETGHQALLDSLKTVHGNQTLERMIEDFAPKHENKTSRYLRFLRNKTGVRDNRKIKDFSDAQFEKLWRAIEQMEGNRRRGTITETKDTKKQITKVQKNKKGTIISYFVEEFGWLSKPQAIELAGRGEIDAVVATSRSGNTFLRSRPNMTAIDNLDEMG